jgi:hypothetical protein
MCHDLPLCDFGDFDTGVTLAVTDRVTIIFTFFVLKGDDFRAFGFAEDFGVDCAFCEVGGVELWGRPIAYEKHFVELESVFGRMEEFDVEFVPFLDSILFAARFDDGVLRHSNSDIMGAMLIDFPQRCQRGM